MGGKLARPLWLLVLASLAVGAAVAEDRAAAITEIRPESTPRQTRLVVACTAPVAYTYYSPDPLTLVVDIPEVDPSKVPSRINVGTREVESVRVTSMVRADGRSLARVEVRLASLVPYQIFSKDATRNLVFDRAPESASTAPAPKAAAPEPTPVAAVPAPAAPAEAPRADAKASEDGRLADGSIVIAPRNKRRPAPATEAAAPRVDRHPASRIVAVTPSNEDGRLSLDVKADGTLRYQDFFLGNPDRLVIDFKDVLSRANVRTLDVHTDPVRKIRLAQFSASSPRVARLVLDLSARAPYHIVDSEDGVKILFGEGEVPKAAPLAALKPEADPAAAAEAGGVGAAMLPAPAPAPVPVPVLPDPQTAPAAQPVRPPEFEPVTLNPGEKQYVGHPISLDFKDGDLQDIFRLFADISGLNIVVNPGVSGKVTLKLNEVPWDQALDLILKANGLGYTLEGNVIRIAKLSDLQKEEQDRRKLEEEKALAGNLEVWNKTLSYAKATEMQDTVKKVALSARGTITLDPRTNTMIITDLPANLAKARDLIALERTGHGSLLSTPKVTTQNNHSAEIKQGVQIPIQTVANNTVTVTFKDAVLTLKVTPQITEANTVILDLNVENNAADFANL